MAAKAAKKTTDDIEATIRAFLEGSIDVVSASGKLVVSNGKLVSYDQTIAERAVDARYIKVARTDTLRNQYQRAHVTKLQELADHRTVRFVPTVFGV